MNIGLNGLSVEQARARVLSALAERWPNVSFRVHDPATLAREFGWVFTLEVVAAVETTAPTNARVIPRLALVHRMTAQTIGTSRQYDAEQLAAVFERLLVMSGVNARNWCLTPDAHLGGKPLSIADEAQAAGLEELAAATEDSPI